MKNIRTAFSIYTGNIEAVLFLSVVILTPFLAIHQWVASICYYIGAFYGNPLFGDFANSFLVVLFLTICQLPFARFTLAEMEDEENRMKKSFVLFIKYGFSTFLFGILFSLGTFFGLFAFILPGVAIMIFFYLTPIVMAIKDQPARKSWKPAAALAKKHFFKLVLLLVAVTFIEIILGYLVNVGVAMITLNTLAITLSQMLLTLLLFPLMTIIMTVYSKQWFDELYPFAPTVNHREANTAPPKKVGFIQ
ncbi:hypothetical protein [Falsibacillus pallidus]|uniref:hypothetical protein n=1 Tax=Falsibacillus pallidus TaxID=493781 RepID=UPI003D966E5D